MIGLMRLQELLIEEPIGLQRFVRTACSHRSRFRGMDEFHA